MKLLSKRVFLNSYFCFGVTKYARQKTHFPFAAFERRSNGHVIIHVKNAEDEEACFEIHGRDTIRLEDWLCRSREMNCRP